jgi:small subunit ribosomal protein S15
MLTKRKKQNAINKVSLHDTDTGSPEAQVAILSKRIEELSSHLKINRKDNHSRRGLIQMISDRRAHLKYLMTSDKKRYEKLVKALEL